MVIFIIVVTSIFSALAFQRPELMYHYNFSPYQVIHRKQYYRLFTHAMLHADWMHLIINMLVLYSFANALVSYFNYFFDFMPAFLLLLLFYVVAIIVSSLASLIKEKDNYNYSAVGASGAVSAVVFACIFFAPLDKILFFGVLPIPGILFGVAYLYYSWYMGKKNADNIGHDAHFWGAVFGFIFPVILRPSLIEFFIRQITNW